ncbi:MAG TPA: T9SS type A sorting domain-containing protein, partial [Chitinophagales bacterium]|nr:T9SS type A sorting domain-containing protein [Chitinophagales bacterium]
VAQTPDWQAHLVVEQPWNGNTDTIIIGLDYDATDGYDAAFDVIDTNFQYPLAMRSRIVDLETDSGFCAANMKVNVKAFAPVVTWDIYIKADSFDGNDLEPPFDSIALFKWDTTEFNYEDAQYFLEYALIYTVTGYIHAIDLTSYCLATNTFFCEGTSGGGFVDLYTELYYYFGIWPEEYFFGDCSTEEHIFKLTLKVVFTDLLPVENILSLCPEIINDINTSTISIDFNNPGNYIIKVFNLYGQQISLPNYSSTALFYFNYSSLPKGYYIVTILDENHNKYNYNFIKP